VKVRVGFYVLGRFMGLDVEIGQDFVVFGLGFERLGFW
jgi:hypothetical protein